MSEAKIDGMIAFNPNLDPVEECPYFAGTELYDEWMEGWEEAEMECGSQKEKSNSEYEWDIESYNCPWKEDEFCRATDMVCEYETCAPWYLIKGR